MGHQRALLLLCISSLLLGICHADFWDTFQVTYGEQNVNLDSSTGVVGISLSGDGTGCTIQSWDQYLFGSFSAEIQLVPGNSAGTVAAFFAISADNGTDNNQHDEIDFEFLGNASGQPYKIQTNVFANGTGGREEQSYLWFDPTAAFHTYQVVWNHLQILWLVDDIPIRVYTNIENVNPLSFPTFRPMNIATCIFDGSSWATEGGGIPINYTMAPFTVTYQNFVFDACLADSGFANCTTNYSGNWWEGGKYATFSTDWQNQMAWFRKYYMVYNYCTDTTRYPTPPPECSYDHAV